MMGVKEILPNGHKNPDFNTLGNGLEHNFPVSAASLATSSIESGETVKKKPEL